MAAEDLQLGKDHWFTLYKVSTTFTPACAFSQVVLPLAFSAKDYDHQRKNTVHLTGSSWHYTLVSDNSGTSRYKQWLNGESKSDDRDTKHPTLTAFYCKSDSEVSDHKALTDSKEESQGEPHCKNFLQKWLKTFSWLQCNYERDIVTCTVCMKDCKGNEYVTGKSCPHKGWKKEYLTRHKNCVDHRNAAKEPEMALQAKRCMSRGCQAEGNSEDCDMQTKLTVLHMHTTVSCIVLIYVEKLFGSIILISDAQKIQLMNQPLKIFHFDPDIKNLQH